MSDSSPRVFSLAEANELVGLVTGFTEEVVQQLETIRQRYKIGSGNLSPEMPESVLQEVEEALRDWSEKISDLGASPKGYFTVDFQSIDPELLYCWTYGEEKISYTHKVWENFSNRRPLAKSAESSTDHLKWIN